ncbi:hypothetical protein AB0B13_01695 [Streptomyces sp. NPDC042898]|uniref:hypothetical protein n=1 Tax=Streptomyces sp. NPDC042898 TaxID=3154334 RepID=UPI0033E7471A
MDLDALRFGDFSKLGTAAGDWEAMGKKLWELESDARDDLGGKAAKANWEGVNATFTKEFIGKTAKEFADAATQATSIANILKDTHGELVDYKKQLNDVIEHRRPGADHARRPDRVRLLGRRLLQPGPCRAGDEGRRADRGPAEEEG